MQAKELLEKAVALVTGDRSDTHGNMYKNHENIAKLWNGYMYNKRTIYPEDVANMMELMKVARRKIGGLNPDDYIDGAGYAAVAWRCAVEETGLDDEE